MIVAVDFDGTIFTNKYPKVGEPIEPVINYLKYLRQQGYKLILWTCRTGDSLIEAVKACEKVGLKFDAVNQNINERRMVQPSRKVYADLYIDDKCKNVETIRRFYE